MIRFVEISGIYEDNSDLEFAFYNTIDGTFISFDGEYTFNSVKLWRSCDALHTKASMARCEALIPDKWINT